jgi:bifunctional UDP-N-acetylglucosamine pyrophosphorylase / glucosamine-1-phosphate N-acetyltransferase
VALTTVILAAGQGKRMNSDLPKVLQPLAGRSILSHVLATANALGSESINIVYGHGGDLVRKEFEASSVEWTLQAEQLGTGHALKQALPSIPKDHQVLILFGDVPLITEASLKKLLKAARGGAIALLTAELSNPKGYGRVLRNGQNEVIAIVEEKDATSEQRLVKEINTGLMVVPGKSIHDWIKALSDDNQQGEFYLTDVISIASAEGVPVVGVLVEHIEEIVGINDRVQLAEAERILQRRQAREVMVQGATLADPERFDLRGSLKVGRDVFIDVGAIFLGDTQLGNRVRIGPNAVISNSVLGDDCIVREHCVMEGVVTGTECEIGPFARLRPGTEFDKQVKVGNFVEVKASTVGVGSKMNHLSYVGDSHVGENTNIGAGTITCNYDGASKHRTTIGDRVFIGSGAMLVAPLEIADDATIAAGSTITKNVPEQTLAVARSRQSLNKGWKRPKKPSR